MTSPLEVRFRNATPQDVSAVVALVESAYRGEPSRAGWTTEADLLDGQRTDAAHVLGLISTPGSRILIAERAGSVVGSVLLTSEGSDAYLGLFAVRPVLQDTGLGRTLLREAERIAHDELNAGAIRMTVIAQRADLIAWYERRGYARTGEREPFPYGDLRCGIPKRDDLYFIVLSKALRSVPVVPPH